MIFDSLPNLARFTSSIPHLERALEFLAGVTPDHPSGQVTIDAHGMYAAIDRYVTEPRSRRFFECHRKFIDLQVVLSGVEGVGVCDRNMCQQSQYDEEQDFRKLTFDGEVSSLVLAPGYGALFFPDDAHMPKLVHGETPSNIVKIVVKIPVL